LTFAVKYVYIVTIGEQQPLKPDTAINHFGRDSRTHTAYKEVRMDYRSQLARKFGVVGVYLSIIPFSLYGLVLGARYGLETGSGVANALFSAGAHIEIVDRFIIGGSMISGIIVSGALTASLCFSFFWSVGRLLGRAAGPGGKTSGKLCDATGAEGKTAWTT